jgi:hypothetical protein
MMIKGKLRFYATPVLWICQHYFSTGDMQSGVGNAVVGLCNAERAECVQFGLTGKMQILGERLCLNDIRKN